MKRQLHLHLSRCRRLWMSWCQCRASAVASFVLAPCTQIHQPGIVYKGDRGRVHSVICEHDSKYKLLTLGASFVHPSCGNGLEMSLGTRESCLGSNLPRLGLSTLPSRFGLSNPTLSRFLRLFDRDCTVYFVDILRNMAADYRASSVTGIVGTMSFSIQLLPVPGFTPEYRPVDLDWSTLVVTECCQSLEIKRGSRRPLSIKDVQCGHRPLQLSRDP